MSKLLRFLPEQCEDVKQGRKTMTRRPVERLTSDWIQGQDFDILSDPVRIAVHLHGNSFAEMISCPYGAVGDPVPLLQPNDHVFAKGEITSLAVERVQEISEADCIAEGIRKFVPTAEDAVVMGSAPLYQRPGQRDFIGGWSAQHAFFSLWDSIYADKGLGVAEKPWVWVVGLKVVGG